MRALKTALERGTFDRVYLFHGEDEFLKETAVRALVARATDPATRDFNLEILRSGESDTAGLALALDALPVMSERRVVILRDVTGLKKDARGVLDRYLGRPASENILVLVAQAGAKLDAALSIHTTSVEFKPLSENDLGKWVTHQVISQGGAITPGAVGLLCNATGNDLGLLSGEIDKLLSYTGGEIDEAAVGAIVGVKHGETLGDLLDRVGTRDGSGATSLLGRVLAQPKTTGVSIVMALTTQTLAMGWALAARERGVPQHQLAAGLFDLLKENPSSVVGRPWGEGVKSWMRMMEHWNADAIDHALLSLMAADASLKDARVSSEEQVLMSVVLALAANASHQTAA